MVEAEAALAPLRPQTSLLLRLRVLPPAGLLLAGRHREAGARGKPRRLQQLADLGAEEEEEEGRVGPLVVGVGVEAAEPSALAGRASRKS